MNNQFEYVDVLNFGSGLPATRGVCRPRHNYSDRRFVIQESRPVSGGTWDLFPYPGLRSHSASYTHSYGLKPCGDQPAIADSEVR